MRFCPRSIQTCLKFKQQDSSEQNLEAAWKELEYLASDGKLLLFVDNVDKPLNGDPGLQPTICRKNCRKIKYR